jgi:DNA-binding CsgD family transcriptional regulator
MIKFWVTTTRRICRGGSEGKMTAIYPLLLRIAQSGSVAEVWEQTTGYFAALGFSRVNYGYTRFRSDRSIGDPDDALYLTTIGDAYAAAYFRNGFYAKTPAYRWAQNNVGACTWTWVREAALAGKLSAEEMETLKYNMTIGVTAGISISFPETSARAKGAMGLIADIGISPEAVDALFAERQQELQSVANMMHLKLIQMPVTSRRRALTSRQREALEWVADGKTSQDVALLMGVSAAMVEKHLRLARETLAVDTTTQAVAKAALMNLIFQRPPAAGEPVSGDAR